jgi:Domain of unknown function (DUF5615)
VSDPHWPASRAGVLRLAADENFNQDIIRGLLRRKPDLDLVRVQDAGLSGASDPALLEWAAAHDRLLLTHDVTTVTHYAYERVGAGRRMPGSRGQSVRAIGASHRRHPAFSRA